MQDSKEPHTLQDQRKERRKELRNRSKLWKQHREYRRKLSAGEPITAEDRQQEQQYIEYCYQCNLKEDILDIEDKLSCLLGTIERANFRGYILNKAAYYLDLKDLQEIKATGERISQYALILCTVLADAETEHIQRTSKRNKC